MLHIARSNVILANVISIACTDQTRASCETETLADFRRQLLLALLAFQHATIEFREHPGNLGIDRSKEAVLNSGEREDFASLADADLTEMMHLPALGSRNPILVLVLAGLGSFGVYWLFSGMLGLALPTGPFGW